MRDHFPPVSLQRRLAQIGGDCAFNHKRDCVTYVRAIFNLKGYPKGDAVNPIVITVLQHIIFKDWVWQQLGIDGKRLFG